MQYYKMGASDECDNNSDCMYRLGIITLQSPLGDVNEAIHFFIRAESLGSSHSCFELGKIYEFDSLNIDLQDRLKQVGIERDPSRALTYYYKCASGYDYSLAQWKLGHCYEHGLLGLRVHALKSLGWYYKSVQHSLPNTMGLLGIAGWYLTGIPGVLQPDRQEALQWFHKVLLQPNASPVVKKRALFAQTLVQDTLAV